MLVDDVHIRPIHFVKEKQVFMNKTMVTNPNLNSIPKPNQTLNPYLDDLFSVSTGRNYDQKSVEK